MTRHTRTGGVVVAILLAIAVLAPQLAAQLNRVSTAQIVGAFVTLGTLPAATGTIRLPNAATVNFRNAANSADVAALSVNSSNNILLGTGLTVSGGTTFSNFGLSTVFATNTAPIIGTCGSSPSVVSSNGTVTFNVNVGTGGVATTCAVTLPAALTGWNCLVNDQTTTSASVFLQKQTANSTTSVTFTNFNTSAVATAFAASDILHATCVEY